MGPEAPHSQPPYYTQGYLVFIFIFILNFSPHFRSHHHPMLVTVTCILTVTEHMNTYMNTGISQEPLDFELRSTSVVHLSRSEFCACAKFSLILI